MGWIEGRRVQAGERPLRPWRWETEVSRAGMEVVGVERSEWFERDLRVRMSKIW